MTDTQVLLYGHGRLGGIVSVEPYPSAGSATIYRRTPDGLVRESVPLQAWLLARKRLDGSVELAGRHPLRHLLLTPEARNVQIWTQTLASDQRLTYLDP